MMWAMCVLSVLTKVSLQDGVRICNRAFCRDSSDGM